MSKDAVVVQEVTLGYAVQQASPALPSGYKQTEVGVIPMEWEAKSLPQVAWFQEGPGLRNWQFTSSGMKVINVTNLESGFLNLDRTDRHISLDEFHQTYSHFAIDAGDIVVASSGNSYCKAAVVRQQDLPLVMNTSVIRFKPADSTDQGYLWALLNSPIFKGQIDLMITGGAQPNFGPYHLSRVIVPLPSKTEQRAIAVALSDVDALLQELDRLIAKKRDIKQATMQQLLTGQTRLPGFAGKWTTRRLGDHAQFLKNGVNSRSELADDGSVRYLHYGDIHASKGVLLDSACLPFLPRQKAKPLGRLQKGDLIIADASEDLDGVGKSVELLCIEDREVVSGLHTIAIRFDKGVLADGFKAYLQFHPHFIGKLRRLAAGTKVYATTRSHVASVEIVLPNVREQAEIALLLQQMDAEIELIECRRDKVAAIKQGMMQELLTGRTRLVGAANPGLDRAMRKTNEPKANIHFIRSVLAAEIVDQLHEEPTFGHVKFEKVLFLVEHLCEVDTGSTYHRQAAGPYDNRALRSIDTQLRKQKWFDARKEGARYRYVSMSNRGQHRQYFERYFGGLESRLVEIIDTFRKFDTERCEIVATLFSAWEDLLKRNGRVSDDMIVHEVLNHWHESKRRIPEDRWLNALGWMREKGFVPKGADSS